MKTPKNKKIVVAVLVALLATLYGGYFLVKRYEENKEYKEFVKYMEEYKNDTYGGKTPEETLQLFINALKAGDTDLAAKYFVFGKREKMKNDLKIGKERGNLEKFLEYLNNPKKGKEVYEGAYIITFYKDKKVLMRIDLFFNKQAKIWKIESL